MLPTQKEKIPVARCEVTVRRYEVADTNNNKHRARQPEKKAPFLFPSGGFRGG